MGSRYYITEVQLRRLMSVWERRFKMDLLKRIMDNQMIENWSETKQAIQMILQVNVKLEKLQIEVEQLTKKCLECLGETEDGNV